jgi:hypothetical protein
VGNEKSPLNKLSIRRLKCKVKACTNYICKKFHYDRNKCATCRNDCGFEATDAMGHLLKWIPKLALILGCVNAGIMMGLVAAVVLIL